MLSSKDRMEDRMRLARLEAENEKLKAQAGGSSDEQVQQVRPLLGQDGPTHTPTHTTAVPCPSGDGRAPGWQHSSLPALCALAAAERPARGSE